MYYAISDVFMNNDEKYSPAIHIRVLRDRCSSTCNDVQYCIYTGGYQ